MSGRTPGPSEGRYIPSRMARTPITPLRLPPGDRAALEAIAADMGVSLSTAIRRMIHEEAERRGLAGHAAAALVARLRERYGANAGVRIEDSGSDHVLTIRGEKPVEARAIALTDSDGIHLLIEPTDGGAGEIIVRTETIGYTGELTWDGTLAQLAARPS